MTMTMTGLSRDYSRFSMERNFANHPLLSKAVFLGPVGNTAMSGKQLVNLASLGLFPGISGAEGPGGYNTGGDVVQTTSDGLDINALWSTFQSVLAIYNERRSRLVQILTFPVQTLIETVPQVGEATFEMASEFGVPKGIRAELSYFQLAYDFDDYDLATRYTWRFLRDADARQVEAIHQQALGADNRLIFKKVMEALFVKGNRDADINSKNYTVFALYNGDGAIPPKYKDISFTGSHSHYMTSGNAVIDSEDFEDAYENIAHHGYGIEQGTTFVSLHNRDEIKEIRKWRAGEANGAADAVATYDFIPAANQPAMIVPNADGLLGSQPQQTWNGLPVIGSYAGVLIVEEQYIPSGWFVMLGSGGDGDLQNPVGLREHANPAYRGLRLLPGNQQQYPLIDSYYARAFGTGIRQRGGAVVMMIGGDGTSATYDAPDEYKRNGVLAA